MGVDTDASNSCIPPTHPLTRQALPLPTATRGEPVFLDGHGGRLNDNDGAKAPLVMYATGKLIVVRELDVAGSSTSAASTTLTSPCGTPSTGGFVYRGHSAPVTAAKFNPAGTYVASGDARGRLRVWAWDHEEHLPRLDVQLLAGPVRDLCWDFEGKRLAATGDGRQSADSSKVVMWDTGVKCGDLAAHARKKGAACAFRPCRPMRIATGGAEDATLFFHKGPPFQRVVGDGASEKCHERGAVHSVRYNGDGSLVASVGTDGSVCFYEGKNLALIRRMEKVHHASIFACAWNRGGTHLLTCGADGCARLLDAAAGAVVHEWDLTAAQTGERGSKVPMGAMQLGCTFVKGDVPVSVGYNGQITVLPVPSSVGLTPSPLTGMTDKPWIITGHQAPISAMVFGAPGTDTAKLLYTSDTDGAIVEWDGATGQPRGRVRNVAEEDPDATGKVHAGATISSLVVDGAGNLFSAGWDDNVRVTTGRLCKEKLALGAQPRAAAVGTSLVVVVTVEGLVLIREGQMASEPIRLPYTATAACLSPDDATLFVGGEDCNVYVYRVAPSGDAAHPLEEVHVIKGGQRQPIQSLALSPDRTTLAVADSKDVCLYDAAAGYVAVVAKGRWCFHAQRIGCLAWSPCGRILASGGNDDSIFLWCPAKKTRRVHYRFAHRGGVTGLGFVGDNAAGGGGDWRLVSAGVDGCVNWWNVEEDANSKFGL